MASQSSILLASLFLLLIVGILAKPQGPPDPPGHGHHGPPPHLPFLRNVSRAEVRQFFQIVTSGNETKAQIRSDLQSWAQQAGVSAAYANFTSLEQQRAQQFQANVTSNLAGQALQLFNRLWTIRQDESITRVAECQQIRSAMNGTSPIVRRLVPMPPPSLPGPPPRGCFPRPHPHHHSHSHSHSHEGPPHGGLGGGPGGPAETAEMDMRNEIEAEEEE